VQTGGAISIARTPTSISADGVNYSTLSLKLRNRNLSAISGASLNYTLPTNLVIASPNGLTTNKCNNPTPSVAAAAGSSSISITGAKIPAAADNTGKFGQCIVSVRVVTSSAGSYSIQVPAGSFGAGLPSFSVSNIAVLTATGVTAAKSFSPTSVGPGAKSTLTLTLQNGKTSAATITSFTDNLLNTMGSGFGVAASPPASTTCAGATLGAAPNATSITLSGGSIPATSNCTITVPVQVGAAVTLGPKTNTIAVNGLQTSQGNNTAAASATLTVAAPTVSKAFLPASVVQGQDSALTITLNNPTTAAATITSFADNLTTMDAAGRVMIAPTPAASTTCAASSLTAPSGATSISLSGGSIPATSNCTISVPVRPAPGIVTGTKTNTVAAGALQTSVGSNIAPASADLTVTEGMTCGKSFSPTSVGPGSVSRATVTINHAAGAQPFTGLAFTDNLPTGMTVAPTPNVSNTCGGTVTATPGANSFALAGGAIPGTAAASCTVSLNLVAPNANATNTIAKGQFTTAEGYSCSTDAAAALTVSAAPNVTLNKSFAPDVINGGAPSQLKIDVVNTASGAASLANVSLTDVFPTGMIVYGTPNATFSGAGCSAGTITADPDTSQISLNSAAVGVNATCSLKVNVTSFENGTLTNGIPASTLTSPQGATNSNSPSATLTVQSNLNIVQFFDPPTIATGGASALHLRILNSSGSNATGAVPALTDNLPAGVTVATGATTNTCVGGALTDGGGGLLGAGDNSVRLNGGTFPANGFCDITVPVTAALNGDYANTIPANSLTTVFGSTNPDSSTSTLKVVAKPTIADAFTPTSIGRGGTSTVTFTLTNSNSSALLPGGLTGAAFTDTLSNMSIASPGPAGGTCVGADGNAFAGGNTSLTFSGITIPPAGNTCTVTIVVTSTVVGLHSNQTSGVLTNQTQTVGAASNVATLTVLIPPTLAKSFAPATIPAGQTSAMMITLSNPNASTAISGAAITDTYPIAVRNSASPSGVTNCTGGTVTAAANGGSAALTGGTIPAGGSCTVTVNITSNTAGTHTNIIAAGGLTTSNAGPNNAAASANLVVNAVPLTAVKSLRTYSDPVNGTINPKAIPGALVDYKITVDNRGAVSPDVDTVIITDAVPVNVSLFVGDLGGAGSGPVVLTDGSPPSGLSYTYASLEETEDDVDFSSNGGADNFTYIPQPNADGVDSLVTHIRVNPKGVFNNGTNFQLTFRVQVE